MATQKLHFRRLFLVIFTAVLMISAALSSIQAQEGLVPLPGVSTRDFTEVQVLESPTGYLTYGYSVAADGDLLAFGATLDDAAQTPVVQVYHRNSSGVWVYEATLVMDDDEVVDPPQFTGLGSNIVISGNTIFVAAPSVDSRPDESEFDIDDGAVYIFEKNGSGNWMQVAKIVGSEAGQNGFGESMALDGDLAIVLENDGRMGGDGRAYFFSRDNAGIWQSEGFVHPPFDIFALPNVSDIDIQGNLATLTAYDTELDLSGVLIYERSGGTWVLSTFLPSDPNTEFGEIKLLGNTIFVRNSFFDFSNPSTSNSWVSVFENNGGTWTETQTLLPDASNIYFGTQLDAEGNLLAIGNPRDTSQQGAVYLFSWNGSAWVREDKITQPGSLFFGNLLALSDGTLFVASNDSIYIYAVDGPPSTPEPTSEPTGEPTSGPTATSVPATQTPVPPTSTPDTTPDPTSEPTSEEEQQVLTNSSFEQQLNGWTLKNASGDKPVCNTASKTVAYEGLCAFQFKAKPGENAKLVQTVSGIQTGDTLTLSGYVKAKGSSVSSKVKVVVWYLDDVTPKSKITVNISSATGGNYVSLSTFQPVLATNVVATPQKVKLIIQNKGQSGKVLYDALSLLAQ